MYIRVGIGGTVAVVLPARTALRFHSFIRSNTEQDNNIKTVSYLVWGGTL